MPHADLGEVPHVGVLTIQILGSYFCVITLLKAIIYLKY